MPWPCEDCAGTPASRYLFDIIEKAFHEAPNEPEPYRTQIILLALECSKHETDIKDDNGIVVVDHATHCQHMQDAMNAINSADWQACIDELEHGPGGGGSVMWLDNAFRTLDKSMAKERAVWERLKELIKIKWPDLPDLPDPPAGSWSGDPH